MQLNEKVESAFNEWWKREGKGLLKPPFNSMVTAEQMERIAHISWLECACVTLQIENEADLDELNKLKQGE